MFQALHESIKHSSENLSKSAFSGLRRHTSDKKRILLHMMIAFNIANIPEWKELLSAERGARLVCQYLSYSSFFRNDLKKLAVKVINFWFALLDFYGGLGMPEMEDKRRYCLKIFSVKSILKFPVKGWISLRYWHEFYVALLNDWVWGKCQKRYLCEMF